MESYTRVVVIKVKYGDVVRRFSALIAEGELILTMDVLKRKILSLFTLTPDTELILTYVDEDNDVVNLVDDDDIHDVLRQGLNPLRITVAVSAEKSGKQSTHSSASSSHLSSPERIRDSLMKLSAKLAFKASSTTGLSEFLGSFAEMGMSGLDQLLVSHSRNDLERFRIDPAPLLSNEAPDLPSKNIESLEKLEPQAVNRSNEVKIPTVAGGSVLGISTFDSTAVAAALNSLNTHSTKPSNDPSPNPVPLPFYISPGYNKEKVKKTIETTPLSPAAGKPELSDGPTKSCLQQVPRLLMDPFSGTAQGNASYVPPNSACNSVFSGCPVQNYGNQKTVHNGVCCDGCYIKPIRGSRFKSKVKEDYDLCSTCFEKMGDHKDYFRMDFPAAYGLYNGGGLL